MRVAALRMPRQPIVRDRLPRRRRAYELPHARPDARVLVERAHPDPDRVGVARVAAEQRRAAIAAEPLLTAHLRLPRAQPVLTRDDPERAGRGMGVRRRRSAASPLAAP